jgi:hypothetical protein
MIFLDRIHLFHLFAHSLELVLVLGVAAESAANASVAATLENNDIALGRQQPLIMLIYATIKTYKLVTEV